MSFFITEEVYIQHKADLCKDVSLAIGEQLAQVQLFFSLNVSNVIMLLGGQAIL